MSAATRPAGPDTAGRAATRLMRFTVGGATCAFPLDRVGEVVSLSHLPARTPRGWVGALRRDRELVPVADLAFLLGFPAAPGAVRAILFRPGRGGREAGLRYGVTTDDVPTVALAGPVAPAPLPTAAGPAARALVAGVLVDGAGLTLVLNAAAVVAALQPGLGRDASGAVKELRELPPAPTFLADAAPRGSSLAGTDAALAWPLPTLALAPPGPTTAIGAAVPVVPLAWVREVLAAPPCHALPQAPRGVAGLVAWRGQSLLVRDLREPGAGAPTGADRLLIVGPPDGDALGALLAPGVHGLLTLAAPAPPPATPWRQGVPVAAWARQGGRAVAVLDVAALFA